MNKTIENQQKKPALPAVYATFFRCLRFQLSTGIIYIVACLGRVPIILGNTALRYPIFGRFRQGILCPTN